MTAILAICVTALLTGSSVFGLGVVLFVGGMGAWLGTTGLWASIVVVTCAIVLHRIELVTHNTQEDVMQVALEQAVCYARRNSSDELKQEAR